MDALEKIFDVKALLYSATPAQFFLVFVLPFFLTSINRRMVAFFIKIYRLAPIEEGMSHLTVEQTLPRLEFSNALKPVLYYLSKPFRIFLIIAFALNIPSNLNGFIYPYSSPSFKFINVLYLIYSLVAVIYNIQMLSKKNSSQFSLSIRKFLANIFLPITYVHFFVFLYFLLYENIYTLLVYSCLEEGVPFWLGIILLLIGFIPATVVLSDMLDTDPKGVRGILVLFLASGMICVLLLIAGLCYKAF
jgi:hypothetical protein